MRSRAHTRVLVVEDEPSDALMVRRSLLRTEGGESRFEVRHATTLAEALERLRREPADVLLLDLGLPDSDGLDTVVRSRVRAPDLPLVVLTGSDDPTLAARTLEAGADGHLVKGEFGGSALRGLLLEAVERRAGPEEPRHATRPGERDRRLLHELRNLNALVLSNAEILCEEAVGRPELQARADAVVRAARLASALTQRLSARLDAEGAGAEDLDVSALLRGAEPLLRAVVPARIALRLAPAEDLPPVRAPGERVLAALLELVSNAVDAIGEAEGKLELTTAAGVVEAGAALVAGGAFEPGLHVWLEVRDDGRGFDAAALLGRPRSATRPQGKGYSASPLEQLLADGAALFVESRPGAGAVFRILLRALSA